MTPPCSIGRQRSNGITEAKTSPQQRKILALLVTKGPPGPSVPAQEEGAQRNVRAQRSGERYISEATA